MRVAVTGATGFLGRHLVKQLRQRGHQVTAITRPTSNVQSLQEWGVTCQNASLDRPDELACAFAKCDAVFHLAGAVDFAADWQRFQQINVDGTRHVIEAARRCGVPRLIHCSSIVAVGASREPGRLDETARWNLVGLDVPYVTTKRQAEEVALAANGKGLDVVVVNPACILGPDDEAGSEFGTLCQRFWKHRLPIHFGGGNNFVDVRDVALGMVSAWNIGRPGERYILGGQNRTMTAFFSELAKAAGEAIPRIRLPNSLGPFVAWTEAHFSSGRRHRAYLSAAQAKLLPYFFYFDCSKAQRELGFTARPIAATLADSFHSWQSQRAA